MKARTLLLCLGAIIASGHFAAGQPDVDYAEYYFDTDPGPGNGTEIDLPQPFGPTLDLSVDIPAPTIAALEDGFHSLVVRFRDDQGDYSIAFVRTFRKGADTAPAPTPDIVAAEYYFDIDPGPGNGTAITLPETPGPSIDLKVDIPKETIDALEVGFHKLVVRVQDAEGDWSVAFLRTIRRVEPPSTESIDPKVSRIDYQWLVDGEEVGETTSLTPEKPAQTIEFTHIADLVGLDGVTAVLRMTPFDEAGNQGHPAFRQVIIEWLDVDMDGFPDQWEALYEGFSDQEINDKEKDSDEDGLTDWEEFLAQTSPNLQDTDGDGMTDYAEVQLVRLGFDPAVIDSDLLEELQTAAIGSGLFSTEINVRNLNLDVPVIGRDPETGKIFLRIRINQSTTLESSDWAQLAVGSEDVSTTGGDLKITIPDLDDQNYFFQIFADEDFNE